MPNIASMTPSAVKKYIKDILRAQLLDAKRKAIQTGSALAYNAVIPAGLVTAGAVAPHYIDRAVRRYATTSGRNAAEDLAKQVGKIMGVSARKVTAKDIAREISDQQLREALAHKGLQARAGRGPRSRQIKEMLLSHAGELGGIGTTAATVGAAAALPVAPITFPLAAIVGGGSTLIHSLGRQHGAALEKELLPALKRERTKRLAKKVLKTTAEGLGAAALVGGAGALGARLVPRKRQA